ncbi:MAG: DNA/RNA nuclease SfsA [Bacteriovoracales bacterium]|nr:DNA/RNA nuclease SfsA [Bacteriovoracales bacterium]
MGADFDHFIQGKIIKRYKRFLSDVELPTGEVVTAHTPNTGSMRTCWEPGWPVMLSRSDNPKRKLPYTLELTHNGHTWINVNTSRTNDLAVQGIEDGTVAELQGHTELKREQKVKRGRIDILLRYGSRLCYVEVKNVTLLGGKNKALFPDAVSTRGQKHLEDLMELKREGHRACMLFVVSREDVDSFGPAFSHDPRYAELLAQAAKEGVEILVYRCRIHEKGIALATPLPLSIDPAD